MKYIYSFLIVFIAISIYSCNEEQKLKESLATMHSKEVDLGIDSMVCVYSPNDIQYTTKIKLFARGANVKHTNPLLYFIAH